MASWFPPPPTVEATLFATLPRELLAHGEPEWRPASGELSPVFLEGPVTDPHGNLYLVDIPYGRILRLDLESTEFFVVAQYDGEPNGLAMTKEGQLVVADYKQGIMTVDPNNGAVKAWMGRRNLERFKGPNDIIIARNDDIYFTDQGQTGMTDPTGLVYRLSPNGKLDTLISNGPSPNGLVLSPDEKILYVAMTRENSVWRCPLHQDGTTTKVTRFFSIFGQVGPDGLTVDKEGNLFICVPGLSSIFVVKPSGMPLCRIALPDGVEGQLTNCIFGSRDKDKERLYMVRSEAGEVYYLDWNTALLR